VSRKVWSTAFRLCELVRLMILQRSYSANSQSLKAVDQTLRDTLQMVG